MNLSWHRRRYGGCCWIEHQGCTVRLPALGTFEVGASIDKRLAWLDSDQICKSKVSEKTETEP